MRNVPGIDLRAVHRRFLISPNRRPIISVCKAIVRETLLYRVRDLLLLSPLSALTMT